MRFPSLCMAKECVGGLEKPSKYLNWEKWIPRHSGWAEGRTAILATDHFEFKNKKYSSSFKH